MSGKRLLSGAAAVCLGLLVATPGRAEDAGAAAVATQSFVVEYTLMQPRYYCAINPGNDSLDSPGQRYLALAEQWAAGYQDEVCVPGKWPAGVPYVRPNIVASLQWPSIEKLKGNELIRPRALHIEITDGTPAMLDELDARLANPGGGLPPLRPGARYNYDSYARLLNPEGYAPREVLVDGARLRYPEETNDRLDQLVLRYFSHYGKKQQKQASLDLWGYQNGGEPQFGPLAEISVSPDGLLSVRSIPIPWDLIPAGIDPHFNTSFQYRPEETDEGIIRSLRSTLDRRASYSSLAGVVRRTGAVLVYPLLPAGRWEPGHEDAYYALDPAIAAQTQPLHDAYRAAAEEWLAAHPEFSDEDRVRDHARITEHDWGTTGTKMVKGAPSYYYEHIGFLTFELQVVAEDAAQLDELRAKLDSVPGVHPRVERSLQVFDYGGGRVSMGD